MESAVKYVAALNVDAKLVKCYICALFRDSSRTEIVGTAQNHIKFVYPASGRIEIDPNKLWNNIIRTVKAALGEANLTAGQIAFLALATHRGSFTCWNETTGKVYHNFITAQDTRSKQMVKECNDDFMFKTFKASSCLLHCATKRQRYLSESVFDVTNSHVTMRLAWMLENCPKIQKDLREGKVLFGTIDAWLLYRFRHGAKYNKDMEHISDVTNCAATGFYDSFNLQWAKWASMLYPIEKTILPNVVDNSFDFGSIDASIFGSAIKIGTSISDTSAALWGTCCFEKTSVYLKIDNETVLSIITGSSCLGSNNGLTSLVAYKYTNPVSEIEEAVYVLEKTCNDCTAVIDWALKIRLFKDIQSASAMASAVPDSNGVVFVPAFSVTRPRDMTDGSCFIGIKKTTRTEHMVRAVLESLVYKISLMYVSAHKEAQSQSMENFTKIKIDGYVTQNDFICQTIADLISIPVERGSSADATALGAIFLAGVNMGAWSTKNEIRRIRKVDKIFAPNPVNKLKLLRNMRYWEEAVERFKQ